MKTNKNLIENDEITLHFMPRSLFLFAQFALMVKRVEEYQSKQKKSKRMKSLSIALIMMLSTSLGLRAQEETKPKTRPFQISFITPLGTNGLDAWNITNKVSINLYAGYNGGVDGIELSGFGSMLKNDMTGTQISGFGNMIMGTGNGFQGAGNFNYVKGNFKGVQLAGFTNIALSDMNGSQFSGFANVSVDKIEKIQIAGFANYSKGNKTGQLSGFSNVNNGNLKGIQAAGFSNVNTKSVKGVQIAGFANYAKILNGLQIAPFNYVDSLEKGLPIGVFSFVKNGYRAYEISTSETLYGVASFKTGVKQFYNIVSVGASYNNEKTYWGWGYGVGTMFTLKNDWGLAVELLSYHINEDEWFTDAINMHNKLQLTASKKVSKKIEVFGGASWNVNVSELEDSDGNPFKSTFTPYDTFNKTYDNKTNVKMYPGFTAGIRF